MAKGDTKTLDVTNFAKELIKGIDAEKERLSRNEKSRAAYWNADDFGSISGIRDADEWVENNLAKFVVERLKAAKLV